MDPAAVDALADRFFAAVADGDRAALERIYAPDAQVWLNTTGVAQGRDANLAMLQALRARILDWRYEDVRRDPFPGGFVQQHVLRGRNPEGEPIEIAACVVVRVADGVVTRIDEYLDSRVTRPLRAP